MKPIQNQRQNQNQNPNMAGKPQDSTRNFGQPMEKKPMENKKTIKTMDNRSCDKSSGNMGRPRDQSLGRSQGQNTGKH